MKGANEYAEIFGREQHGRLFLYSHSHARGYTFQIWVLPEGITVSNDAPWTCKDAVEVYGVIGGNPGWSEEYGWLHKGKWQNDFQSIVARRKKEIAIEQEQSQQLKKENEQEEKNRIVELLESY